MNIVITGRTGQVSRALQRELVKTHRLIVLGSADLDLCDTLRIAPHLRRLAPDLIINAAAYTAVDQAEREPERAHLLNAAAPGALAAVARELDIPLIHYSTDYVFDGSATEPYRESARPNPLNAYGRSKLAGEEAIRASGCRHLILRTSWVYSHDGHCFFNTMRRLLSERDELQVVGDQIGAPTWADSIARLKAQLIERHAHGNAGPWGLYHLTASGSTSWYGFADAIARRLAQRDELRARLNAVTSEEFPTLAARPRYSQLDCWRLQDAWQVRMPDWEEAFDECWHRVLATLPSTASPA